MLRNRNIFITVLLFIFPYTIVKEDTAAVLLGLIGIIYLIIVSAEIKYNKTYMALLVFLIITGCFSCIFTNNLTKSLNGLSLFIITPVYYLIFSKFSGNRDLHLKYAVYSLAFFTLPYIVYQVLIVNVRLYGNLGYANSYALLLLAGLYINEIIPKEKYYSYFQISLLLGISFTGSRNSILYLGIFIILKLFKDIKNKNNKEISVLFFNISSSGILYLLIEKREFGLLILLPLLWYLASLLIKKITVKNKIILALMLLLGIIAVSFYYKTNMTNRINNVSLGSGVLQERFLYYEDGINHIIKNPFGSGINSFEYKQYQDQTAFYDVKYIHNSVLQIGYDMGIEGIIFFLFVVIYGFLLLCKAENKNKPFILALYLTIFFHSLLDFDLSYPSIFLMLIMLVALYSKGNSVLIKKPFIRLYIYVPLSLLFLYLTFINSVYFIGDKAVSYNNFEAARKLYTINKAITLKDPDPYSKIAETYEMENKTVKNTEVFYKIIDNLSKAEKINPDDPRIIGNLAFCYQNANLPKETIEYYEKFLSKQKYYSTMYVFYYKYLNDKLITTKDNLYRTHLSNLKELYDTNYSNLSPKAAYMKDQMPKTLETAVGKDIPSYNK